MKKRINAVRQFHTAFGLGMKEEPTADLGLAKNTLRFNLMKEENEEYLEAANNNDLVEVADALGDMLYILCGTIIEHGMQHKIEEVFDSTASAKIIERELPKCIKMKVGDLLYLK